MLSNVTLNHKMVELNLFSSKQLLNTLEIKNFQNTKYKFDIFLKA
jgi:hypothetical protein